MSRPMCCNRFRVTIIKVNIGSRLSFYYFTVVARRPLYSPRVKHRMRSAKCAHIVVSYSAAFNFPTLVRTRGAEASHRPGKFEISYSDNNSTFIESEIHGIVC